MKKIDNFVNLYPVTKTLRFKLTPIGKTKENFDKNKLLQVDKERAENYCKAKVIIDKFYNKFISNCLNSFKFKDNPNSLKEYYDVANKDIEKDEKSNKINELQSSLRKEVVLAFKNTETKKLIFDNLFNSKLFNEIIKDKSITNEEKEVIDKFNKFNTYFAGFFKNRESLFSDENKAGCIAYRLINENLKTFVNNIRVYLKIEEVLKTNIETMQNEYKDILKDFSIKDLFDIDYYNFCLTGDDINKYNLIINGYTKNEKIKIKGLNEYINLYNQKNKETSRLPKFKSLYKQILSEDETQNFRFEAINDDTMVYALVDTLVNNFENKELLNSIKETFSRLTKGKYDNRRIYLSSNKFKDLSIKSFEDYNVINVGIGVEYDKKHENERNRKKYEENKDKYVKNIKYLSLEDIEKSIKNVECDKEKVYKAFYDELEELIKVIDNAINGYRTIDRSVSIKNDNRIIGSIKDLLDSLLGLYRFKEQFCKYNESELVDLNFYGEIYELDFLNDIVSVYNKIRNYITKKPYKLDKIKLNFNCATLLNGWDANKEKDNLGVLLLKENKYFLAIMNKNSNNVFQEIKLQNRQNDCYKKVNYKLLPGPNKMLPKVFLSKKGIDTFKPDKRIVDNYNKGTHKKGSAFNKNDMINLINYFKESFDAHINYSNFGFNFKKTEEYNDISEFYKEVSDQGYKITYSNISSEYINQLVDEGKVYLFQIYNKDFSPYSKGAKNLHTLYFEELFDEQNLNDVVYKLNGEAEVFYREKSIECKVTHPKNKPVHNKNDNNYKKESVFKYDLIKDKRFTQDQFEFHVPITINFKAYKDLSSDNVNAAIADCKDNYVIGIDRGERNLVYINVVSEKKGLVEQLSLNDIINEYKGNVYETDYHALLNKKEKERDEAKRSWTTISTIKELKEGYVSQVVHKICELVEKYDAIIVMEDLTSGFKNNRIKVEKQVYQKFEKMLIDKLNLYINKKHKNNENGGLLKGYQLTRPCEGNRKMSFQNGIIFYVAPWNTSKIDPTTGFVNLFRLNNYKTVLSRKTFIRNFDSIAYNKKEDVFEFTFDYKKFEYGATDYICKWTITSFGKRILSYRNKEKNSMWDNVEKYPTEELKELFKNYKIDYISGNLQKEILNIDNKTFYDGLFNALKLILQMRNSISNSEVDYLISPVKNKSGKHYNSDEARKNGDNLPVDADSNGAYNIARKGLMIIERIKKGETKKLTVISNKDWLEYAQTHLPI